MDSGSGAGNFPTSSRSPQTIQQRARAREDHVPRQCRTTALDQDVALVAGNADSGDDAFTVGGHEDNDKNLAYWDNANHLINAIATVNVDTIVVVHSVGPVTLKTRIGGANVTIILRVRTDFPRQET